MAIPWEGLGVLLAATVAALGKSCHSGYLRRAVIDPLLSDKRSAQDAHASIPEIQETVEEVQDTVEEVDDKVDDYAEGVEEVKETIAYVHADELNEDALLRDRLDVNADHDIIQSDD